MSKKTEENLKQKNRILVIDDSRTILILLSKILKNAGYEVTTTALGRDAIELASIVMPHLILLDVHLPDLSGHEVCRKLKNNPATRDIPLVFISGKSDVNERIMGLELGALDYISKPIEKRILLPKVNTYVQLCRDARMVKLMHEELQSSHAELMQFSLALDNASDAICMTNAKGRITYTNQSFQLLANYRPQTEGERSINRYFSDTHQLERVACCALQGVCCTVETLLQRGTLELPVLLKCSAILSTNGAASGLMYQIIDQTELKKSEADRKRLEIELFHSQKLESVGQLASGIAHEINTPVQFVGDNIRFLQDAVTDLFDLQQAQQDLLAAVKKENCCAESVAAVEQALKAADLEYLQEELPVAIEQSQEGVNRVASIVRAMKEFAHPGTTEKAPANLNDAIQTTVTVARNKWKYVARLDTEFDDTLEPVPCLVSEFNQVILNLIVNASDAIGDRVEESGELGRIVISTHARSECAEVRIKDTGGGIPKSIQSRIFDPFFTTKVVGKGSGQGLAIARSVIINKHQGEFRFETEEGIGTTFIIQLPLQTAA